MDDIYFRKSEIPVVFIIFHVYFHDSCSCIFPINESLHDGGQLSGRKVLVFMIVCVCNAFNQHSIGRIIQIDFLILVFHLNDVDCFDALPLEFIHIVSFPCLIVTCFECTLYRIGQCGVRDIRFSHMPVAIRCEPCGCLISIIEVRYIISCLCFPLYVLDVRIPGRECFLQWGRNSN